MARRKPTPRKTRGRPKGNDGVAAKRGAKKRRATRQHPEEGDDVTTPTKEQKVSIRINGQVLPDAIITTTPTDEETPVETPPSVSHPSTENNSDDDDDNDDRNNFGDENENDNNNDDDDDEDDDDDKKKGKNKNDDDDESDDDDKKKKDKNKNDDDDESDDDDEQEYNPEESEDDDSFVDVVPIAPKVQKKKKPTILEGPAPEATWLHWMNVSKGYEEDDDGRIVQEFDTEDRDECAVQVWKWFCHTALTPITQKIKTKNGKGVTSRKWATPDYLIELGACLLIRWRYNYPVHVMQMGRKTLADVPHIMHPTARKAVEKLIIRFEQVHPFLGKLTPSDFLRNAKYGQRLQVRSVLLSTKYVVYFVICRYLHSHTLSFCLYAIVII